MLTAKRNRKRRGSSRKGSSEKGPVSPQRKRAERKRGEQWGARGPGSGNCKKRSGWGERGGGSSQHGQTGPGKRARRPSDSRGGGELDKQGNENARERTDAPLRRIRGPSSKCCRGEGKIRPLLTVSLGGGGTGGKELPKKRKKKGRGKGHPYRGGGETQRRTGSSSGR